MSTQALARRPAADPAENGLVVLRSQLEQRASEFKMALPSHISPEKFQRTVLTAVQQNPQLLAADRRSFLTACMKAAQDALLPDGREAALVQFNTRQKIEGEWRSVQLIQYMPMVFGLRKKILQSGEVKDIQAAVVYRQEVDAGLFIYEEGTERTLRHKPLLDPEFEPDDADICAAYSVATFKDGSMSFEVMRRSEINKVRQTSQTGAEGRKDRQGNPIEPKGPWVDWFAEMAKKTVIRRHSKTLPMSGDIIDVEADEISAARSAIAMLGAVAGSEPEAIDDAPQIPPRRGDAVYDLETGEVLRDDEDPVEEQAEEQQPEQERQQAAATTGPAKAKPLVERMKEAREGAGEADQERAVEDEDDGLGDWPAWLTELESDLAACTTPIDVNSHWGNVKRVVNEAPQQIQEKAVELKDNRLAALKKN